MRNLHTQSQNAFLSDFSKVCFGVVLTLLVLSLPKKRGSHHASVKVTGHLNSKILSFCMHVNGEIDHDFWLKEHCDL